MTAAGSPSGLDFEAWYRREHPRVLAALAVAAGDVELAREATDEAFARAYQRWTKVAGMESPGGWLHRVALNELRRRSRRRTLERELLRRQHDQPRADGSPPPIADPRVWDAVRALPGRQRSAIALRYVLDLTEKEVAMTMKISRGAASATLSAARKTLQDALREPVADPPQSGERKQSASPAATGPWRAMTDKTRTDKATIDG